MRRHCWESGNIDYLGKDSFDNIWRKIQSTVDAKNKQDATPQTPPALTTATSTTVATKATESSVETSKKEGN